MPTSQSPPRVCVIHAGGTIGMRRGAGGHYAPAPGLLEDYLAEQAGSLSELIPSYEVATLEPLLDSADMGPNDWLRIANAVVDRYDRYDGFVVVHGTDTMAYSASALSFLLPGLGKPVIFTGSQLSLTHPRTDGREHLVSATIIAASLAIPEVCIYFAGRLLRGNRSQKVDNDDYFAFDCGNFPPLAKVGVSIRVSWELVRTAGNGELREVSFAGDPKIAAIRLYPGLDAPMLSRFLQPPLDAIVLETYGAGNAPSRDRALMRVIADAVQERDVVMVNCSQCHGGAVRQDLYSTGAELAKLGVVSGVDMTAEAALTKLYALIGRGLAPAAVRDAVAQNLAGELSPLG